MKNRLLRFDLMKFLIAILTVLVMTTQSQAGIMVFTDQAAFNAATSGLTFGSEDFSSSTPALLPDNTAVGFNGFTATSTEVGGTSAFYVAPDDFAGAQHAPFTSSQHLGWAESVSTSEFRFIGSTGEGPTISLDFDSPVNAASFQFLDSDNTDEYTLSIDGVSVPTFPSTIDNSFDGAFFFGIFDDTGTFSNLTFAAPVPSTGGFVEEFGIDNIQFSNAGSPDVVPEPTSLAIFLGVAISAIPVRRRRKLA